MLVAIARASLVLAGLVAGQNPSWDNSTRSPFTPIMLHASDSSISAVFLPYGATLQALFVPDRNGTQRDVVLGYDDPVRYSTDPGHPNFGPSNLLSRLKDDFCPDPSLSSHGAGPIVGRYANRIKNNTYTDPETGEVYQSVANENAGANTLHGGPYGWGWRPWTVTNVTADSVTMAFYDPTGLEGFPGAVTSQIVYSLRAGGRFDIDLYAQTTERTPLLLSHHDYFDLDAGSLPNATVRDWTLLMPYASKAVETDSILIPTGTFRNVSGTPLDFLQARPIGERWNGTLGLPGPGKLGFDTCWVNDDWAPATDAKLEVWSPHSGIKLSVTTDQPAIQLYTCSGMDGTTPRKASQGGGFVGKDSCMVFEAEGALAPDR